VGVIGDARYEDAEKPPGPEVMIPYTQTPDRPSLSLLVRTSVPTATVARNVRTDIASIDPAQTVFAIRTMDEVLAGTMAPRKFAAGLLALFAVVTVCLAGVGLYGVLSLWTADRTREIGVRIALGATRANVIKMVMRESIRMSIVGIGIGLVFALMATRILRGLLYGIAVFDAATFILCACFTLVLALVASYLPARRAMSVDPLLSIRQE
jgi:ABC-type antimicrobial peptide transport system permease subunit